MASNAQRVAAADGARESDTAGCPISEGDARASHPDKAQIGISGSATLEDADTRSKAGEDSNYLKIRALLRRPHASDTLSKAADTRDREAGGNSLGVDDNTNDQIESPLSTRVPSMRAQLKAADVMADATNNVEIAATSARQKALLHIARAEVAAETESRIRREFESQVAKLNHELATVKSALSAHQSESTTASDEINEIKQTLETEHAAQLDSLRQNHEEELERLKAEAEEARRNAPEPSPTETQIEQPTAKVQVEQPTSTNQMVGPTFEPANQDDRDRYWQEKINDRLNTARDIWRHQEAERLEKAMADWTAKQERLMLAPTAWEQWIQQWLSVRGFAVAGVVLLLIISIFLFPAVQPIAAKFDFMSAPKVETESPIPAVSKTSAHEPPKSEPEWGMFADDPLSTANARILIEGAEAATEAEVATEARQRLERQVSRLEQDLKAAELRGFSNEIEAQDARDEASRIQEKAERAAVEAKSQALTAAQAEAQMRTSLEKQIEELRRKLIKPKIVRSLPAPVPNFDAD